MMELKKSVFYFRDDDNVDIYVKLEIDYVSRKFSIYPRTGDRFDFSNSDGVWNENVYDKTPECKIILWNKVLILIDQAIEFGNQQITGAKKNDNK